MITELSIEDVLEEISNLPIGEVISIDAASAIRRYLIDNFIDKGDYQLIHILRQDSVSYQNASDYDKFLMDYLREYVTNLYDSY